MAAQKKRNYRRKLTFSDRLLIAQTEMERVTISLPESARSTSAIYHFTDPNGLIGILSSDELWATDIWFLNDSSELFHAEHIQSGVLQGY